jgi:hypothetical protein
MSDAADSMAVACRFATMARKNDPADDTVVIPTVYYAMHHAAEMLRQLDGFLDFCRAIVDADASGA